MRHDKELRHCFLLLRPRPHDDCVAFRQGSLLRPCIVKPPLLQHQVDLDVLDGLDDLALLDLLVQHLVSEVFDIDIIRVVGVPQ